MYLCSPRWFASERASVPCMVLLIPQLTVGEHETYKNTPCQEIRVLATTETSSETITATTKGFGIIV